MGLRITNMVVDGNKLYFVPSEVAAVLEYNLSEQVTQIVTRMPDCNMTDYIRGIVQYANGYLYVAPVAGNMFLVINTKNDEEVSKYEFDCGGKLYNNIKFQGTFLSDKYVGFLGYGFPGIALFDKRSKQLITVEIDLEEHIEEKNPQRVFGKTSAVVNNKLYVPLYGTKSMLIMNLDNLEYEVKREFAEFDLVGVCEAGGEYLGLLPKAEPKLISYDLQSGMTLREVPMPEGACSSGDLWFTQAFQYQGDIWVFPLFSNMLVKMNLDSGNTTCVKHFLKYEQGVYTNAGIFDEMHVWAFYQEENRIDIIDIKTHSVKYLDIQGIEMSPECASEILGYGLCNDKIINLKEYLKYVLGNGDENDKEYERDSIGTKILNRLSNEMFI